MSIQSWQGLLLRMLSLAERQARSHDEGPLVQSIDFSETAARCSIQECGCIVIPVNASAAEAEAAVQGILTRLGMDQPLDLDTPLPPMDFRLSPALHWVELLDDLGGYASQMPDYTGDPALCYEQIRRVGETAIITLTNGEKSLTVTRDLAKADFPIAVPIDLASAFLAQC